MVNWKYTCKRCPGESAEDYLKRHTLCRKKKTYVRGKNKFNVPCGAIRKQRNDIGVQRFYDNSNREKNKGLDSAKRGKNSYSKNVKTWLKPYWWNQLEGWAVNVFTFISSTQTETAFNERYAQLHTSKDRFELAKKTFAQTVSKTSREYIPVYLQALKMFFNLKNALKSTKQRGNIRTYSKKEMENALDSTVPRIGVSDSAATDAEFKQFVSDNGIDAANYADSLKDVMDYPKSKENILANYDDMLINLFRAPQITEKDKYLKKKALFNFFKDLFQYTSVSDINDSDKYLQSFLYFQYDYDGLPPLLGGKIEAGHDEKRKKVDSYPFRAFEVFLDENEPKSGLTLESFRRKEEGELDDKKLSHRYLRGLFHSKSFPVANHYTQDFLENMWKNKNRTGDKVSKTNYSGQLENYKPKNYTVYRVGVGKTRKLQYRTGMGRQTRVTNKLPTMVERIYNPNTGPEWLKHLKKTRQERNGPQQKEVPTLLEEGLSNDTFIRKPRKPNVNKTQKVPKRIQKLEKNIDKLTNELRNLYNEKPPSEAAIKKKEAELHKLIDKKTEYEENPIEEPKKKKIPNKKKDEEMQPNKLDEMQPNELDDLLANFNSEDADLLEPPAPAAAPAAAPEPAAPEPAAPEPAAPEPAAAPAYVQRARDRLVETPKLNPKKISDSAKRAFQDSS